MKFPDHQELKIIGKSSNNQKELHLPQIKSKGTISLTSRVSNPLLKKNNEGYQPIKRPKSIMVELDSIITHRLSPELTSKYQKDINIKLPYITKKYQVTRNYTQNNKDFSEQFNKAKQLKITGRRINTKSEQHQNGEFSNSQFASLLGFHI